MAKKSARERLSDQGFRGEAHPAQSEKIAWAQAFAARHDIPLGRAVQMLHTGNGQATAADIAISLIEWAEVLT